MFALAILIGIYSYGIFLLGLVGMLFPVSIVIFSLTFIICSAFYYAKHRPSFSGLADLVRHKNSITLVLLSFLVIQGFVNVVGALGPELAFDSLWYHLTLPKVYLEHHAVLFIPGNVLHYSTMPKLVEMLYVPAVAFGSDTFAKLIHLLFGILTIVVIYKIARIYLSVTASLIAAAIFYSNLVVGWESITAYVDLAWAFFQTMSLWGIILFIRTNKQMWLYESAVMTGLAITTKILAAGAVPVLVIVFGWSLMKKKVSFKNVAVQAAYFTLIAVLVPLPWLMFSYIHTGNPLYPIFSPFLQPELGFRLLRPDVLINDVFTLFTHAADPVTPLYLISLPIIVLYFRNFSRTGRMVMLFSVLSLLSWYFIPRSGGGRFILPYLPAFSLVVAEVFDIIREKKNNHVLGRILIAVLFITLGISVFYRGAANSKYVPVVLGITPKDEFLGKNLNFSFGDFYDTDGFFKKTITPDDTVLLYGFRNLYYVDFPYIHASWVKKGQAFNYIAVQNGEPPERFRYWAPIYYNPTTRVAVYSLGGQTWIY